MEKPYCPVPPRVYNRDYFMRHRGGSAEFRGTKGKELYHAHRFALVQANLKSTDRVLDFGCGCGEVSLNAGYHAKSVLGIDYSKDAIDLAIDAREYFDDDIRDRVTFVCADIDEYSFSEDAYDVVFFLDTIEHLLQLQIDEALASIYRTLKVGGRVIVHTWPNRWHRNITYPISYRVGRLSGKRRPMDPMTEHERLMHVCEQSPWSVWLNLKRAGFKARVFMRQPGQMGGSLYQRAYHVLHSCHPLKWFFCDHIWGIGVK